MNHIWNYASAEERIKKSIKDLEKITVIDYSKDMSLEKIPKNKAYKCDAVHIYIDILNINDMLNVDDIEGERCHRRTLRFLNLHYRAVDRILSDCDVRRVDFHNQRLHAVVFKPYGEESESERIQKAVALSQMIVNVLNETGDEDNHIPNAKLRVGIDSGVALIVNNGRNGGREPLFLGRPANEAAKLSSSRNSQGIYLTNNSRTEIGLEEVDEPNKNKLSEDEINNCVDAANLGLDKDSIVEEWKQDLENNPIGKFNFSGHTPPLKNLDIINLSPSNSRRQELVSIYADIDGFTNYVKENIDGNAEDIVRSLNVIRTELDQVLTNDFEGRKIRFIGDCLHGIFCLGTAQTTDTIKSITEASLCSGAMRSSFDLSKKLLEENEVEVGNLGLSIGFEYGPTSTTRLGLKGDMVRCSISRAVIESENQQLRCDGLQTAIGKTAYDNADDSIKKLFTSNRKQSNLDYNEVVEFLSEEDEDTGKSAKAEAFATSTPSIIASAAHQIRPHTK
jgi:class 3 adenylate cyclase